MATLLLLLMAWGSTWVHMGWNQAEHAKRVVDNRGWVDKLSLTDLSLFTEARYTRHLTMADRQSAFQEHPLAMDHFPSGSLVAPPALIRR
uniref:Uncharacterized protein n=1 Tax=Magnetococcus massalia (strain MO-1) TaxID=451514 RepID=A0A1S7LM64_MAGMO|nr:Conserved protein of unknown function [Candidatus Magnetococcus massalia]